MSKFDFGIDGTPPGEPQEPKRKLKPPKKDKRWQYIRFGQWKRGRASIVTHAQEEYERKPHPDGSGIKETPFGREINGVPETEINRIQADARQNLDELDRESWRDMATKCWRLGAIEKPRLRAMVAEQFFTGMHYDDPPDLADYAEATGTDVLTAAEELSKVGEFEEKPYGIITGEIRFDEDDIPDPDDDPDDEGGDFYIGEAEVEA